jgi:DNA-binding transcriptional ArsR family regulator
MTLLETLFGNRTAAAVMLFIANNKDAYAQEIANKTDISVNLVQSQLRRLEEGGALVSRPRGRMRFYSFNPRSPFSGTLEGMLQRAIDFIPDEEQDTYITRRRPRMPGKPL